MNKEPFSLTTASGNRIDGFIIRNQKETGKLLVMCHGLTFYENVPYIEDYYKRYSGWGNSVVVFHRKDEDPYNFSVLEHIENIVAVIDHFKDDYDDIRLYGASLGAVATALASMHTDAINKMVIINGLYDPDHDFTIKQTLYKDWYIWTHHDVRKQVDVIRQEFKPQNVTVPTLVVYGDKDEIVKPDQSLHFYEKLTCPKELICIEEGDHPLTHPRYNEEAYPEQFDRLKHWLG